MRMWIFLIAKCILRILPTIFSLIGSMVRIILSVPWSGIVSLVLDSELKLPTSTTLCKICRFLIYRYTFLWINFIAFTANVYKSDTRCIYRQIFYRQRGRKWFDWFLLSIYPRMWSVQRKWIWSYKHSALQLHKFISEMLEKYKFYKIRRVGVHLLHKRDEMLCKNLSSYRMCRIWGIFEFRQTVR